MYSPNEIERNNTEIAKRFNSNNSECCSFVYKDLDLIDHYLSTDVTIKYSSSNQNVISNDGKVTIRP